MTREAVAHPYALQEAYEAARAPPPFTRKANANDALIDFIWLRCGWARVCGGGGSGHVQRAGHLARPNTRMHTGPARTPP